MLLFLGFYPTLLRDTLLVPFFGVRIEQTHLSKGALLDVPVFVRRGGGRGLWVFLFCVVWRHPMNPKEYNLHKSDVNVRKRLIHRRATVSVARGLINFSFVIVVIRKFYRK